MRKVGTYGGGDREGKRRWDGGGERWMIEGEGEGGRKVCVCMGGGGGGE